MSISFPNVHYCVLLLTFLSFSTLEAVEFSQFHLPPCCHFAAHPPSPVVVASSPSEQNGSFALEPAHPRFSTSGEEVFDGDNSNSIYKLVVPLKFPSVMAANAAISVPPLQQQQQEDVMEAAPPIQNHHQESAAVATVTTTLSPLTTITSSTSTQAQKENLKDASSDNMFNVFLYKELEKMRNHRGQHPLPPLHAPKRREETVFDKIAKLGYSMSERLQQISSSFQSIATPPPPGGIGGLFGNVLQNSHGPYQMYKTFVKRQAILPDPAHLHHNEPMKMPAVWIKNLRKALYQSLLSRKGNGEKQASPSIQASPNPKDTDSKLLWKNLRSAKLKFIDLVSQSTSDLPEEIYLPPGQGPIVSGIATLSGASGHLEIRIPSELYTPPMSSDNQGAGSGEGTTDLCKCSLINDGDMILAYWSISRIVTDDGQPALQYLVYPHPYPHQTVNPPTPPQLIPFTNGNPEEFRPSPYDPLPNYFNEISKNQNHHKLPIVTDARHRKPKLYHGERHQHVHNNGDYQIPPPPPPPPSKALVPHLPGRGVPITENGKYTEDFLSLYRDAIDHHFHNIDSMKSMIIGDGENIEDFIHQHFPHQQQQHPPPPPPHHRVPASLKPPLQQQNYLPDIPYGGGYLEGPPTSIPGIATPLDPNANDHPKSIQDILSPFIPPPPAPQQISPPRHHPNQNQQSQIYHGNNDNGNVDDGLYYEDDRKYQNPNIPPQPFHSNRPLQPTGQQKPFNYRPATPSQNGIPYNDYYNNVPEKPYYPITNNQYDEKRHPDRDLPKKQAYIKEYFYNNKQGRRNGNFAHRIGGRLGGSLNDIDNPDGYILDFKK